MDMFGKGRPRKSKRSKKYATGYDSESFGECEGGEYEGGLYAPYEKKVGLKRAKQIGNRRMREMGMTIEERRYEQRDPERHDARRLRYIHKMPKGKIIHRVARVKKGRAKVDTPALSKWRNFLVTYKKLRKFVTGTGKKGAYKDFLREASEAWHQRNFYLAQKR